MSKSVATKLSEIAECLSKLRDVFALFLHKYSQMQPGSSCLNIAHRPNILFETLYK